MPTMLKLQWQIDDEVYEYRLNPERDMMIGRHSECDITLFDEKVSRHHAVIHFEDGKAILRNVSEGNPIIVVTPDDRYSLSQEDGIELSAGQVLKIGMFGFKVLSHDPDTEPSRWVICPNCGNEVEDTGGDCPSCGKTLAFARLV